MDVLALGTQLLDILDRLAADHLDPTFGCGCLRLPQLFAPVGEPFEQVRVECFARHFRARHYQLPVVPHVPQLADLGRADLAPLVLHKDHVAGGLGHRGLHSGRLPFSALVARYAQLREFQRQFVRDLFGLVGGGIVDNQDFEARRDVWK